MYKSWEELSKVEQLRSEYSDFHKEVRGFRPAPNENWDSEEWLAERIDALAKESVQVEAEEARREKVCIANFEARVTDTIKLGAKDRETAIRWIADAADVDGDMEFLCFKLGLPYNYFKVAA